ncbi:MAG: glycosyltransferase [Flavobacteriales bacterium AspAUS03]
MKKIKKKKILFRSGPGMEGGAEKSLLNLLYHLDYSKHQVDVLLRYKSGIYWKKIPKEVGLYHLVKGKDLFYKTPLTRLVQKIWSSLTLYVYRIFPYWIYQYKLKNTSYDVEIAWLHSFIFDMVKSPLKSKKIVWIHSDFTKVYESKSLMNKSLHDLQSMDKIVTVSKQAQDILLSLAPELEKNTQMVYNIIDADEIIRKAGSEDVKRQTRLLNLIAIGRLSKEKGFERLIDICHDLKQESIGPFTLSIIGTGYHSYQSKLSNQIKTLDLEDTVKLLGFKENPYPYLQAADIFVLSSHFEGLPYVVLEALILNKPIVSTDVVGSRELLKDGELGLLVDNSEKGLYHGLKRMIRDESLRNSFIHKKKDFSMFESKHIARQVEELINNL